MMRGILRRRLLAALVAALCPLATAGAQQLDTRGGLGTVPDATMAPAAAAAAAGLKVYLADQTGKLGTLDLGNGAVHVIGSMGHVMTDIAFCPGGTRYAIDFTRLFRINPANASRTAIGGGFGNLGMNALVCDASGQLFAHNFRTSRLFKINKASGAATVVGATGAFKSDGDLAFHEGGLFLTTEANKLVKLNKATAAVISSKPYAINDMYGLISTGRDKLYGFSETRAYRFTENAQGPTGGKVLLFNFAGRGLQATNGAAFNGNFQN
jgi:outer membrane protein assembly factor BamB